MAGPAGPRGDKVSQLRPHAATSPFPSAPLTRGKSCMTRRPAPILGWPTSELPICPSGSPTAPPEVREAHAGISPTCARTSACARKHGVIRGVLTPAPAVKHHQHHGATLLRFQFPSSSTYQYRIGPLRSDLRAANPQWRHFNTIVSADRGEADIQANNRKCMAFIARKFCDIAIHIREAIGISQ